MDGWVDGRTGRHKAIALIDYTRICVSADISGHVLLEQSLLMLYLII